MEAYYGDVVRAIAGLFSLKESVQEVRYALTGNGTGADNADVPGRVGWAYVRYDDNLSRVVEVFNPRYPGIAEDVPVVVGKERATDGYVQILRPNWEIYFNRLTLRQLQQYAVSKHGDTHHGVTGSDPAYIDLRNLMPGRVRATDVPGLSVYAEALYYDYAGVVTFFPGAAIDLTASVPAVAGFHRYTLVSIDPATNSLASVDGDLFPEAETPDPPTVPLTHIPLACALLVQGTTVIQDQDISDYRILFTGPGASTAGLVNEIALLAEFLVQELSDHVIHGSAP